MQITWDDQVSVWLESSPGCPQILIGNRSSQVSLNMKDVEQQPLDQDQDTASS